MEAFQDKETVIVDYEPRYQGVFKRLNEEWISRYFRMEPIDHTLLDHPEENIIRPGGHILVALHGGEPLGVCALCRPGHGDYDYELAKLAVDDRAKGLGLGKALCRAAVRKARLLGGRSILIETNSRLGPAVHIYRSLGFREIENSGAQFERVDLMMELRL